MKTSHIVCVWLALFGVSGSCQGLTNDFFAERTLIVGTNVTVLGSNHAAGIESGEDTGSGSVQVLHSVWYAWTSPTDGVLEVSVRALGWNSISVQTYRGPTVDSLSLAAANSGGGISVTGGDTLVIRVASIHDTISGTGGEKGPFELTLSLRPSAPTASNDDFANRLSISEPVYQFQGGIDGAGNETGETVPSGSIRTLWWKYSATESGELAVYPSATEFTPTLTLFEGDRLDALTPVSPTGANRYPVEQGREYALQLAGGDVPNGAFSLNVAFLPRNDFFANRTRLEGTNFVFAGTFTGATLEPGEPDPGYTNTVWLSWTAPVSGRARFSRPTVSWARPVAVFTGPAVDLLEPVHVVGVGNSLFDFHALAGTVYHFQISGIGENYELTLDLFEFTMVTNDAFATAANAPLGQQWVSIESATAEFGEPAHLDETAFKSLWWNWVAPCHGLAEFTARRSLTTNVLVAIYQGNHVAALRLLGKGAEPVNIWVVGGETYRVAAVVPATATGDVLMDGRITWPSSDTRIVPGNLLREPSWEGTAIHNAQHWETSGLIGGYVNEAGCDGTTWPVVPGGVRIWQDFNVAPGTKYSIRFAAKAVGGVFGDPHGDVRVRVEWDNHTVGVGVLSGVEIGGWHWLEFTHTASNAAARIVFDNLGRNVELDAFSVVALTDPPSIVTQPTSTSVLAGGTAAFIVGAEGSSPLKYHWLFNGAPYSIQDSPMLVLDGITPVNAGTYQVLITNAFGTALSVPVKLTVESANKPVILWQPHGGRVGEGGYHNFSVVAAGSPPLRYQWQKDGSDLLHATNRTLTIDPVGPAQAGVYSILIQNHAGSVLSLRARLSLTDAQNGGGTILYMNWPANPSDPDARVFDLDGVTTLSGSNYLSQLYGGSSIEMLRPVGRPVPFHSGVASGYFGLETLILPNVVPGATAVLQVRAWDGATGSSYEEARALGGRFGRSEVFTAIAGGNMFFTPARLDGLRSFRLQAGRPQFATGRITFIEEQPGGRMVWSHRGEPGFRYVIERSIQGFTWQPFTVISNATTNAVFTDAVTNATTTVFYRSRILD